MTPSIVCASLLPPPLKRSRHHWLLNHVNHVSDAQELAAMNFRLATDALVAEYHDILRKPVEWRSREAAHTHRRKEQIVTELITIAKRFVPSLSLSQMHQASQLSTSVLTVKESTPTVTPKHKSCESDHRPCAPSPVAEECEEDDTHTRDEQPHHPTASFMHYSGGAQQQQSVTPHHTQQSVSPSSLYQRRAQFKQVINNYRTLLNQTNRAFTS